MRVDGSLWLPDVVPVLAQQHRDPSQDHEGGQDAKGQRVASLPTEALNVLPKNLKLLFKPVNE